ncbi:MAG: hypothetical protein J6Y03_03475 [Alphaproteobacteria bacterium]|nr:hypothetical protein [Alphaproteobacteria bacterium]
MTDKKKLTQKLWKGIRCLINEYRDAGQLVKDIKKEAYGIKKAAWEEEVDNAFEEVMKAFAICGVLLSLIVGMEVGLNKWEREKIDKPEAAVKNIEKLNIQTKEFNAQDLVLEHYFYPPAKEVPAMAPFTVIVNQKVRE